MSRLKNADRLVTYGLLAHINDHEAGLADFSDVFVPLVEYALSDLWECQAVENGKIEDLRDQVSRLFQIKIPFPLLERFLEHAAERLNARSETECVKVHGDHSFQLKRVTLDEIGEAIQAQRQAVAYVEELYKEFLRSRGVSEPPDSLYDFIDQNRLQLAAYFSRNDEIEIPNNADFTLPAEFVQSCLTNRQAFLTLRRLYVGSVISSSILSTRN